MLFVIEDIVNIVLVVYDSSKGTSKNTFILFQYDLQNIKHGPTLEPIA